MGLGGGGGAGVARRRRGNGAREGGCGSAAGAVRLGVRRANAWRACGVEGGGPHRQICSGCKALSRDRLCPLTPTPSSGRTLGSRHVSSLQCIQCTREHSFGCSRHVVPSVHRRRRARTAPSHTPSAPLRTADNSLSGCCGDLFVDHLTCVGLFGSGRRTGMASLSALTVPPPFPLWYVHGCQKNK